MTTRKELISKIDYIIANANPPLTNMGISAMLDSINTSHGTDLTFRDIPCLQSGTVSDANVTKEKKDVIPGAVLIAAPAILTTLVGHCMNPDHGIEKLLILGGITAGAVALNEPLTEIAKMKHGDKLLSLGGTMLPMLALGIVRSRARKE